jgi:glycosidase
MRAFALVLLFLSAGCVPRQPPVVLETSAPATVALVWDGAGPGDPGDVSEALAAAVVDELEARNLKVQRIDASAFGAEFGRRRATGQRIQWLRERESGHVVLLEVRTAYYNQINGLFRWTASFRASVVGAGEDLPVDASFEVPVFLQFQHQDGVEAMDAARDVAKKRVGRLLDAVLGAGDGSSDAGDGAEPRAGPDPDDDAGAQNGPGGHDLGPVYFVLVDRFFNGDPSNDGDADPSDPQAFHGGDLRGVIDRLDHLQALGVRTVWLSPVFRMRTDKIGDWGAYHGYWPTGEEGVEPRFGTDADLVELSDALHRRGMKLLLDVVLNHVGYDVPLVAQKPAWFHRRGDVDDWADPEQATQFDVHGLPDLDHENAEVVAWLDERAAGWIDRYRPDGFRLDAVRHVPVAFWRHFNDRVRALAGDEFVLLGELFEGDPKKLDATWREAGFSHMFDFPLYYALTDVLCDGAPAGRLASMLAQDPIYADPSRLVTFVDNHDLPRIASRCPDGAEAFSLLAHLRGQPALYQGTEFGMQGAEEPANRADVRWSSAADPRIAAALRERSSLALGSGIEQIVALSDTELVLLTRNRAGGAVISLAKAGDRWRARAESGPNVASPPVPRNGRLTLAAPGAGLRLVGAGDLLGNWQPGAGLPGLRDPRGRTVFGFDVPGGAVLEYKLVRPTPGGGWDWEPRGNRYLFVDGDASLDLSWGE